MYARFSLVLGLMLLLTVASVAHALDFELPSGNTLSVRIYGKGGDRLLWLPAEYAGSPAAERVLGEGLAALGYEVWYARLHDSYFLNPGRESLQAVPRTDIATLIDKAVPAHGHLFLFSYGRGAALTLEAARLWQLAHPRGPELGGVVLLHPNLLAGVAEAGKAGEYLPIIDATNLPVFILQPANSARRWYLGEVTRRLGTGGSTVYARILPGVGDGFAVRPEASPGELAMRPKLPGIIRQSLAVLAQNAGGIRQAVKVLPKLGESAAQLGSAAAGLEPIAGAPLAPGLTLNDMAGQRQELAALRGRVVLVNFWATWCPPCVHEIPSLGSLANRLTGRDFSVLSVAVGESAAQVAGFLAKVPAHFPVLLDSNGSAVKPWHVRAFPTSFLIDRHGRIRYGYFGGLQWDAPGVVALIDKLLAEPAGNLTEAKLGK